MATRWATALTKSKIRARDIWLIPAATLLLAGSAKIAVPFYPVPMTLQTLAVVGLGFALGPRRAVAVVMLYLAEGAAGLPVFAGTPEKGIGLVYMLGPTGGYLAGYLPAAFVAGWANARNLTSNPFSAALAGIMASALVYVPGLLWLGAVIGFDKPILAYGLYPFLLGDITKAVLAALVVVAGRAVLKRRADH